MKKFFIITLFGVLIIKMYGCSEKITNTDIYKKCNNQNIKQTKHRVWPEYKDRWVVTFNGMTYNQRFYNVYPGTRSRNLDFVFVVIADIDDDCEKAYQFIDWIEYKNKYTDDTIHLITALFERDSTGHPTATFVFPKSEVRYYL